MSLRARGLVVVVYALTLAACASAPTQQDSQAPQQAARPDATQPDAEKPKPMALEIQTQKPKTEAKAVAPVAKAKDLLWKMKNGILSGPQKATPKSIGQIKDPKSGAVTKIRCWNYKDFRSPNQKPKAKSARAK